MMGRRLSGWLVLARLFQVLGSFIPGAMNGWLLYYISANKLGPSSLMLVLEILVCIRHLLSRSIMARFLRSWNFLGLLQHMPSRSYSGLTTMTGSCLVCLCVALTIDDTHTPAIRTNSLHGVQCMSGCGVLLRRHHHRLLIILHQSTVELFRSHDNNLYDFPRMCLHDLHIMHLLTFLS